MARKSGPPLGLVIAIESGLIPILRALWLARQRKKRRLPPLSLKRAARPVEKLDTGGALAWEAVNSLTLPLLANSTAPSVSAIAIAAAAASNIGCATNPRTRTQSEGAQSSGGTPFGLELAACEPVF